jgi:hypothetical protein
LVSTATIIFFSVCLPLFLLTYPLALRVISLTSAPTDTIGAGALFGFSAAHLYYLDLERWWQERAAPGEYYWYTNPRGKYRIGMMIHLGAILPGSILVVFQFLPVIRKRVMLVHRVNGYIVVLLVLVANVGALMIGRRTFGGDVCTQAAFGLLVVLSTVGLLLALWNARCLQVDQHRAWMLRTVAAMGSIITTRVIMVIAAKVITLIGTYSKEMTCGEVEYIWRKNPARFLERYPGCANESDLVSVTAHWGSNPDETGASMRVVFGMATWVAIFLHLLAAEVYLKLTPREAQRLRLIAYKKQLEAGYRHPGSAGLVIERWGDAEPWRPRHDDIGLERVAAPLALKAHSASQLLVSPPSY